jgi:hypothetical protein
MSSVFEQLYEAWKKGTMDECIRALVQREKPPACDSHDWGEGGLDIRLCGSRFLLQELWARGMDAMPQFGVMWNVLCGHTHMFPSSKAASKGEEWLMVDTWSPEATPHGVKDLLSMPIIPQYEPRKMDEKFDLEMDFPSMVHQHRFNVWFSWALDEFTQASRQRIHEFWAPLLEIFHLKNLLETPRAQGKSTLCWGCLSWDMDPNDVTKAVLPAFRQQLHVVRQCVFGPQAADALRRKEDTSAHKARPVVVGAKRSKSDRASDFTPDELRWHEVCEKRVLLWQDDVLTVVDAFQRAGARKAVRLEQQRPQRGRRWYELMINEDMPFRAAAVKKQMVKEAKAAKQATTCDPALQAVVRLTCHAAVRMANDMNVGIGGHVLAML